MKIPKTFLPDKNLDKKIDLFKEIYTTPTEATPEDLTDPFMYFLYGENATVHEKDKIEEEAVCKIVQDSLENSITWEEDQNICKHRGGTGYRTKVTILNYKNKPITLPATFAVIEGKGYLSIGTMLGPCRNTYHKQVRKLAIEHFKMDQKYLV